MVETSPKKPRSRAWVASIVALSLVGAGAIGGTVWYGTQILPKQNDKRTQAACLVFEKGYAAARDGFLAEATATDHEASFAVALTNYLKPLTQGAVAAGSKVVKGSEIDKNLVMLRASLSQFGAATKTFTAKTLPFPHKSDAYAKRVETLCSQYININPYKR